MPSTSAIGLFFIAKLTPVLTKFLLEHLLGANELAVELLQTGMKEATSGLGLFLSRNPALGKQVESIARGLAAELARGNEGDQERLEPVLVAVADTIDAALIDVRSLARHNLDAKSLGITLRQHKPKGLLGIEEALCDRILDRLAARVLQLLWTRPEIQSAALQELLLRSDTASVKQEQVQLAIRRLEAASAAIGPLATRMEQYCDRLSEDADELTADFERRYRSVVTDALDRMHLYGVQATEASMRHPLSVAYIRLSARLTDVDQALIVDEALAGQKRILIRGDPGSGKTTLLRWLAVRAASQDFDGPLFDWNTLIPYYVALRNTVTRTSATTNFRFPHARDFVPMATGPLREPEGSNWTERMLGSGRALVLLDGIDEVPDEFRSDLLDHLHRLFIAYPEATFVVSTRPYALPDDWRGRDGFSELRLEDLTLDDMYRLIDHWHQAVERELALQKLSGEIPELANLAESLKYQIRAKRALFDVARKPLLCAVLCALNRDRRASVPEGRIQLYVACLEMLLSRRDPERGVTDAEGLELDYTRKMEVLQRLAYWFVVNGLSEADIEDVLQQLRRKLPDLFLQDAIRSEDRAPQILEHLCRRSGVVREPAVDKVDWVHNTFKEFLAAREAVSDDRVGDLLAHSREVRWHEVIVFAAGLGTRMQKEKIFQALLKDTDARSGFLAAECLEVCPSLAVDLRLKVFERVSNVIPPRNPDQARYVAAGGDAAVPFLSPKPEWGEWERCMAIEALSRIGTRAAIEMIEEYAEGATDAVLAALTGLWDVAPNRTGYAKNVLARVLRNRESWMPAGLKSLEGLEELAVCTRLKSLDLHFCEIDDITPLAALQMLQHLNLADTGVSDLAPLSGLAELRELNLRYTRVSDISALIKCRNLKRVDLTGLSIKNELMMNFRAALPDVKVQLSRDSSPKGTRKGRRRTVAR